MNTIDEKELRRLRDEYMETLRDASNWPRQSDAHKALMDYLGANLPSPPTSAAPQVEACPVCDFKCGHFSDSDTKVLCLAPNCGYACGSLAAHNRLSRRVHAMNEIEAEVEEYEHNPNAVSVPTILDIAVFGPRPQCKHQRDRDAHKDSVESVLREFEDWVLIGSPVNEYSPWRVTRMKNIHKPHELSDPIDDMYLLSALRALLER